MCVLSLRSSARSQPAVQRASPIPEKEPRLKPAPGPGEGVGGARLGSGGAPCRGALHAGVTLRPLPRLVSSRTTEGFGAGLSQPWRSGLAEPAARIPLGASSEGSQFAAQNRCVSSTQLALRPGEASCGAWQGRATVPALPLVSHRWKHRVCRGFTVTTLCLAACCFTPARAVPGRAVRGLPGCGCLPGRARVRSGGENSASALGWCQPLNLGQVVPVRQGSLLHNLHLLGFLNVNFLFIFFIISPALRCRGAGGAVQQQQRSDAARCLPQPWHPLPWR